MFCFKAYFCVIKISIFPGINLALFPNQLVLWLPRHIVSLPVIVLD